MTGTRLEHDSQKTEHGPTGVPKNWNLSGTWSRRTRWKSEHDTHRVPIFFMTTIALTHPAWKGESDDPFVLPYPPPDATLGTCPDFASPPVSACQPPNDKIAQVCARV
ncbi:TPA: hypothetical protein HA274_02745 [Candidatus Bathyarchaeota archaeon]|nr:hypothetical protein [Candidatus Bathyarchaeota archaeon]